MKKDSGLTLIEVLISVAIFAIFSIGIYQGFSAIYTAIASARHKALAADLINERFESIKNMPYSSVGIVGGTPSGTLLAEETMIRDDISFEVETTIMNVDDPYDSLSGTGDSFPADYKLVEISVFCATCKSFSPLVITGRVAPRNLESL